MNPLAAIAEQYLRMLPSSTGNRHEGMYVRLASKYGVPFGRIVAVSGLSATTVAAHLEENS